MAIRKKNHKIILFFLAYKHRMPPLMVVKRAIASGTIIKGGIDAPSLSSPAATPSLIAH